MKIDGDELIQIQEEVKECLADGWDIEELAEELYNCENNFNNADVTSGQRCYTFDEIHDAVFKTQEEE